MPWLSEENYKSIQNYLIYSQDKEAGQTLIKLVEEVETNREIEESEQKSDFLESLTNEYAEKDRVEQVLYFLLLASLLVAMIGIPTSIFLQQPRQITFFLNEYGDRCVKIDRSERIIETLCADNIPRQLNLFTKYELILKDKNAQKIN